MKKYIVAMSVIAMASIGYSKFHNHDLCEGIVEENDMWISTTQVSENGMDEETFNAVIDRMEDLYSDIFSDLGAMLQVERKWDSGTVNAYASRTGNLWKVHMHGGLARHDVMTDDGFALVVCHEIGHHIGGAPKKSFGWATNEGQADYWGNLKCMRKYLSGLDHEAYLSDKDVPEFVVDLCEQSYAALQDQLACQRMSLAGESLAFLFQDLRKEERAPRFDTPSEEKVSKTVHSHPKTQCRMDTYFNGGLCTASASKDVDQNDPSVGTCMNSDEYGSRPTCWFAL